MSMYIGKQVDKTIFSINRVAGGDVNLHYAPDTNSIFHSDMPHLFVKKRHVATLSLADNDYYVGTLPGELPNILKNVNNVVIPILVFSDGSNEYYHQMVGISKSQTYVFSESYAGIGYAHQFGGCISFDLNLEWGYYQESGRSVADTLGEYSTGGYHVYNVESGDDFDPGSASARSQGLVSARTDNPTGRNQSRNFTPRNNPPYNNLRNWEPYDLVNPDYLHPLGPSSAVYNRVFVRRQGARNLTRQGNRFAGITYTKLNYPEFPGTETEDANEYRRAGIERHLANGLIAGWTAANYPITPVRMEFLELNLTWTHTSGYAAVNLFTGTDIKISKTDFTIKGQDLRNTQYEMLASVSMSAPSISNTFFTANIETGSPTDLADGGGYRLWGSRADGVMASWAATNVDDSIGVGAPWNIGIYKFPTNSSVEIDSPSSTIKMNGVPVWSPDVRPLQLFSSNKASNLLIGDNEYLRAIATGGTMLLNSANIGLVPSDTSTVIMSIEWMSNDLCGPAGDPSIEYLVSYRQPTNITPAGIAKRFTKLNYDIGDGVSHQILVLRPGVFVPIMVTNSFSYATSSAGKPRTRFQYYIRKNGDTGVIEFWACSRALRLSTPIGPVPTAPYIQFPLFRINVQRLT